MEKSEFSPKSLTLTLNEQTSLIIDLKSCVIFVFLWSFVCFYKKADILFSSCQESIMQRWRRTTFLL